MFQTTVGSPVIIKEELLASRETLIKAGYCNIPLCLVGSTWLMSGGLKERSSNWTAQMKTSNMTGPQSDGYTVQVQSMND